MKPVRWTLHALQSLTDRQIDRAEADKALAAPDRVAAGRRGRRIMLRRYEDAILRQPMLLYVVIEEQPDERVVMTVYKTSRLERYSEGDIP